MAKKRKVSVLDYVTEEMSNKIDDIGYEFLKSLGYDTEGDRATYSFTNKIKRQLKEHKHALLYQGAYNDKGEMLVYFQIAELGTEKSKTPKILFTSQGIKFVPKRKDGGANGENPQSD